MKASEILKAQKAEIEKMDIGSLKTKLLQETIKDLVEINEAIAELEALQSRSCDGCKFHDDVGWDDWCCDCIRKWTIDRYEAKEQ